MAARQKEMIADEVHQNQILRELYLKELRTQKLYTQYHVNPLRKVHPITRKPMSWHDNLEEPADGLVPAWPPESPPLTILSIQPCLHLPSSEFASLSPSGLFFYLYIVSPVPSPGPHLQESRDHVCLTLLYLQGSNSAWHRVCAQQMFVER
ncbi:uncharacterized protein LOC102510742 isoform X1 [Camelus ferus]|uniref:Uncharacterized protein LOC102510742 isoform X1 n=2 Tax=Camelus TaxID=9836 RepID=A0A8B8U6L3_CAMFR|nr:uncharacterized protein LOC102510742 isoform X1 [Camelus ferus]